MSSTASARRPPPSRYDEPGCGHQRSKDAAARTAGCPAPTPGSAAGGCSFDGSMITLVPIADAAHVIHGPIGCLGNSWEARGSLSSGRQLNRRGFTSDVTEHDVVFGGEQKVYDLVLEVAREHRPAAVFVYSTCVTALIGDDLDAVCSAAAARAGLPVVPVHAPGFAGSKNFGNRLAGAALLEHVIGTREPGQAPPPGVHEVNLVGEYNIAGELWNVTPVLDRLGIRMRARITGDGRYGDIATAHRAEATMVVCSRALLPLARGLQERYGVPWFEGSFYGIRAMADALRGFATTLGDPVLASRVEDVIAEQEALVRAALEPLRHRLAGVRAVLYTGGVKSWSMISALQDVGVEVVASGATKSTPEDVDRMTALLGPDARIVRDGKPAQLIEIVRETGADILIAGGRNQYTALKSRLPFLDVNQERHVPLAGYPGVPELARQLVRALDNPVWSQVRKDAPWDRTAASLQGA
ncbi:MAG TPA: nitrogenase iron-molybdenum cofactor biosynthesis protein NifE [Kineosporiaceae bacterium]